MSISPAGCPRPSRLVLAVTSILVLVVAGWWAPSRASSAVGADIPAGWQAVTLPDLGAPPGGWLTQVSCAPATTFCAAVAGVFTSDVLRPWGLLSTRDGQHWTGSRGFPRWLGYPNGFACPAVSVCYVSGVTTTWHRSLHYFDYSGSIAKTTDAGQSWSNLTPKAWSLVGRWTFALSRGDNSLDCPTPGTCWIVGEVNHRRTYHGVTSVYGLPAVSMTSDGGASWTVNSDLPPELGGSWRTPTATPWQPYEVAGISCSSTTNCAMAGGYGYPATDEHAVALESANTGATWYLSRSLAVASLWFLYDVTCPPAGPTCLSAGVALGVGHGPQKKLPAGPVVLVSRDGGAAWDSGTEFGSRGHPVGPAQSVSCVPGGRCWLTFGASDSWLPWSPERVVELAESSDGGASWLPMKWPTSGGRVLSVTCMTADVCFLERNRDGPSDTPAQLLETSDGGAGIPRSSTAPALSRQLPILTRDSASAVAGASTSVVGQDRGAKVGTAVDVSIESPDGQTQSESTTVQLNNYLVAPVASPALGISRIGLSVGGHLVARIELHAYLTRRPVVQSVEARPGEPASVTIRGSGFESGSSVLFGDQRSPDVKILSPTQLIAVAPKASFSTPWIEDVTVVTPGGGPSVRCAADQYVAGD